MKNIFKILAAAALALWTAGPALADAPTVPMNLTATAVSPTQVNLMWDASTMATSSASSTLAGYNLFRDGSQIGNTGLTNFSDTGLTASTTYTYFVSAFDTGGNSSGNSSSTMVTTLAAQTPTSTPTSTPDTTAPSIPTGLMATSSSSSSIMLSWTASTDPDNSSSDLSYLVFRGGSQIATTSTGTPSFTDNGLGANTNYSYTVAARDPAGNTSGQSSSISAMTMGSSTTTPTSTPPNIPPPSINGAWGFAIIPLDLYNALQGSTTTPTSTPPSSPYNYVNGYPMLGSNFVDCNGNVDNDPAHHTTNAADTDPAHHLGQSCSGPGGTPLPPSAMNNGNGNGNNGNGNNGNGSWNSIFNPGSMGIFTFLTPGSGIQWVVVPLTPELVRQLDGMPNTTMNMNMNM